jgi:glutamate formiminotransferase/formiminotetrahydrofolate cyclodeaminase
MQKIVECVPNFSEGKNKSIIEEIISEIRSVTGIDLLSVEMGADVNRTVVTFVGSPESVSKAAFLAIKKAASLIDMSKHKGSHPRMGAIDVCPFVPVSGISMEEVVKLSKKVAQRVGDELKIPVYLYEESAIKPEWKSLANIRKGEYEALAEKLKEPFWKPNFGPAKFNVKSGATAIGAREFLIAYNITLNTKEKKYATDIAFELREKGRSVRIGNIYPFYFKGDLVKNEPGHYPCGSCDFIGKSIDQTTEHCQSEHGYNLTELYDLHGTDPEDPSGRSAKKPGKFKHCRAIGWYVEEYGRAQISINITNYKIAPPHLVLEEARKLATERGLIVTGSEVVGVIPFPAIYEAGKYYLEKQGKSTGIPVKDIIESAIHSMGLNDVSSFEPNKKIIGLLQSNPDDLVEMKTVDLVDEVSRDTPAPGGGSIAALAGALGAALASMVSYLTVGKKGYENFEADLKRLAEQAQGLKDKLLKAVDEDTNAFNAYMEAQRLPQITEDEKNIRERAIQNGLKQAVNVPLTTAILSFESLKVAAVAVEKGNINSVTDAGVGAQIAHTGVIGGIYNVLINLPSISDEDYKKEMKVRCNQLENEAQEILDHTISLVKDKIYKLNN